MAGLRSDGAEGKDDYFAVRWLLRNENNYRDVKPVPYALWIGEEDWVDWTVSSAVSLPDSVDTDLGVGAARFDFDFDNIDVLYSRRSGIGVDGYLWLRSVLLLGIRRTAEIFCGGGRPGGLTAIFYTLNRIRRRAGTMMRMLKERR